MIIQAKEITERHWHQIRDMAIVTSEAEPGVGADLERFHAQRFNEEWNNFLRANSDLSKDCHDELNTLRHRHFESVAEQYAQRKFLIEVELLRKNISAFLKSQVTGEPVQALLNKIDALSQRATRYLGDDAAIYLQRKGGVTQGNLAILRSRSLST